MELSEKDFWHGQLYLWEPDVLEAVGIKGDDAGYLSGVGLPDQVEWNLTIPPVQPVTLPPGYLAVASDGPVLICLNRQGSVVALEPPGERQVNTSATRFGWMLMVYQDYRVRVRCLDDREADELVNEISRRMIQCDGAVMADPEGYWSVVLEQMRQGLL